MTPKRFEIIACEVFRREIDALTRELPSEYRVHYESFGLHDAPETMADALQQVVDAVRDADAVLIGYGLCSRGIVGLTAREIPLVVPRAHDCITLFLGSRKRYAEQFYANPGTYWYSAGWVEQHAGKRDPSSLITPQLEAAKAMKFAEYAAKYGDDNARYLIEMETQWQNHYSRIGYIDTSVGEQDAYRTYAKRLADQNGWAYEEVDGSLDLLRRFLNGDWNDDFLIVPPGQAIRDTANDDIIRAEDLKRMT